MVLVYAYGDAGVTSFIAGLLLGDVSDVRIGSASFLSGAAFVAMTKLVSAAVDAKGGGPFFGNIANALASFYLSLLTKIFPGK